MAINLKLRLFSFSDLADRTLTDPNAFRVDHSQFHQALASHLRFRDPGSDVRLAFQALDRSCCGFLTLPDFISAAQAVAPHLAPGVLAEAFAEVDRDGDGRVSFRQFATLFARV